MPVACISAQVSTRREERSLLEFVRGRIDAGNHGGGRCRMPCAYYQQIAAVQARQQADGRGMPQYLTEADAAAKVKSVDDALLTGSSLSPINEIYYRNVEEGRR